jgi:PAS domain S-box-containing protein
MERKSIILIADDEPSARDTLEALLFREDYDLAFASNGPEALKKAAELTPDLILLDVMMPGLDGFQVCQRLRANPLLAEVPVIMVTALGDRDSRLRGIEAGADGFVSKPLDKTELQARVRTITQLNRYRQLLAERAKFEQVIELSPDGIMVVGIERVIHLANSTMCQMLGAENEENVLGKQVHTFIAPEQLDHCSVYWERVITGTSQVERCETWFVGLDSERFPVEIVAGQFAWDSKPALQIVVRDIAARKRAEEELRKHRDHLEELVDQRTAELTSANRELAREITGRKRVERALRVAKEAAEAARDRERARWWEAEQRRRIAESLGDMLSVLNSNQPLDQVLDHIAVQAGRLLDNQAVAIYRLQGEDGTLSIQAAQGLPGDVVAETDIPIGEEALRRAMECRQPVTVPDVADAPAGDKDLALDARRQRLVASWAKRYRTLLAVPIVVKDQIYGGILLYYVEPRAFSADEVELAVVFGDQVALAIENARLREHIEHAAAIAERERLARELHDAVTQTLFSACMIAEALPRVWGQYPEEGQRGLEELRQLTRGALVEMRTLLLELRPAGLVEKPLDTLLDHLTAAVTNRTRIPITLSAQVEHLLPPDVQIALYRIAQEALNNVVKHAQASRASMDLQCRPEKVVFRVRDDGGGFDPEDVLPDHFGLSIMRERAESIGAILEITSRPGAGTQVMVEWRDREE